MTTAAKLAAVVACCLTLTATAAQRLPDRRPDRFERMTPKELFAWAMNEPLENKPWRVVYRVEMAQTNPVEWGWNVSLEFENAYYRRWPDKAGGLISRWQLAAMEDCEDDQIPPGHVAHSVFHLMVTDGDCGPVRAEW